MVPVFIKVLVSAMSLHNHHDCCVERSGRFCWSWHEL